MAPRQLPLPLRLDDDATFANFFCACGNQQILDLLRQPDKALNRFLWIWGARGAGCTHLLQALCHQHAQLQKAAVYIPLQSYADLHPQILEGLDELDLVCLDEPEHVAGKAEWELALFNLYNQLMAAGTQLVIAARQPPVQLSVRLPDLASRLQTALVWQLSVLNDEEKLQALQMRARGRGFDLPVEVATYLLQRNARDMSSLFAVLQRLDELSLEKKRRITVPLLRQLLEGDT